MIRKTGACALALLLACLTLPARADSTPAGQQAAAEAAAAALQADAARALKPLRATPATAFEGKDAAFRSCMLQRFGHGQDMMPMPEVADTFVREVIQAHRRYWHAALLQPAARAAAEASLLRELQRLLNRPDLADLDTLWEPLSARLEQAGYHVQGGVTPPLREFMLWARQEERRYDVALPEGRHTTQVRLLEGFVSPGWGDYATCSRHGVGGWATEDALYAPVHRYGALDGEEFRVVFLAHETQHFADYTRFPGLQPWELEYRAKLTELSQAEQVRAKLLRKFTENQGDDPGVPHPYANKQVLAALRRQLQLPEGAPLEAQPVERLQTAAVAVLKADSARRNAAAATRATAAPTPPAPATR